MQNDDDAADGEKPVVVKPNVVLTILACGCYIAMGYVAVYGENLFIGFPLMFVGVVGLLWTFSYEIIFNDLGITEKRLGEILNFVSWDKISGVSYQKGDRYSKTGAWYTGFHFYWKDSSKEFHPYDSMYLFAKLHGKTFSKSLWSTRSIFIHKLQRNYIEALKFAVKKLPSQAFMVKARKNLRKMGVDIQVRIKNEKPQSNGLA